MLQSWQGKPAEANHGPLYVPEVDLLNVVNHRLSHRKEYRQANPEEAVKVVVKP